jgi:hypothetical protein
VQAPDFGQHIDDWRDVDPADVDLPESWCCINCGFNTARGFYDRSGMQQAIAAAIAAGDYNTDFAWKITARDEIYMVHSWIWHQAGMAEFGGCLCIGCLEQRLGRRLTPSDFSDHAFNSPRLPASPRLRNRRLGLNRAERRALRSRK